MSAYNPFDPYEEQPHSLLAAYGTNPTSLQSLNAQLLHPNAQLLQSNAQLLQPNAQLLQSNAQLLQPNAQLLQSYHAVTTTKEAASCQSSTYGMVSPPQPILNAILAQTVLPPSQQHFVVPLGLQSLAAQQTSVGLPTAMQHTTAMQQLAAMQQSLPTAALLASQNSTRYTGGEPQALTNQQHRSDERSWSSRVRQPDWDDWGRNNQSFRRDDEAPGWRDWHNHPGAREDWSDWGGRQWGGDERGPRPDGKRFRAERNLTEGRCKFYDKAKGFGFIIPADGGEAVYFKGEHLEGDTTPAQGDYCIYNQKWSKDKKRTWAVSVQAQGSGTESRDPSGLMQDASLSVIQGLWKVQERHDPLSDTPRPRLKQLGEVPAVELRVKRRSEAPAGEGQPGKKRKKEDHKKSKEEGSKGQPREMVSWEKYQQLLKESRDTPAEESHAKAKDKDKKTDADSGELKEGEKLIEGVRVQHQSRFCYVCKCAVPTKSWKIHCSGKKHLTLESGGTPPPKAATTAKAADDEPLPDIPLEELRKHFDRPIGQVSKEFNVRSTAMKKLCKFYGIKKWPHKFIKRGQEKAAAAAAAAEAAENEKEGPGEVPGEVSSEVPGDSAGKEELNRECDDKGATQGAAGGEQQKQGENTQKAAAKEAAGEATAGTVFRAPAVPFAGTIFKAHTKDGERIAISAEYEEMKASLEDKPSPKIERSPKDDAELLNEPDLERRGILALVWLYQEDPGVLKRPPGRPPTGNHRWDPVQGWVPCADGEAADGEEALQALPEEENFLQSGLSRQSLLKLMQDWGQQWAAKRGSHSNVAAEDAAVEDAAPEDAAAGPSARKAYQQWASLDGHSLEALFEAFKQFGPETLKGMAGEDTLQAWATLLRGLVVEQWLRMMVLDDAGFLDQLRQEGANAGAAKGGTKRKFPQQRPNLGNKRAILYAVERYLQSLPDDGWRIDTKEASCKLFHQVLYTTDIKTVVMEKLPTGYPTSPRTAV